MRWILFFFFVLLLSHIFATPISILSHTSKTAIDYICFSLGTSFLWIFIGIYCLPKFPISLKYKFLINFSVLLGFFETIQRPICRLAFPLDKAPVLKEGQNLCDAATGLPLSLIGFIAALFIASLIQEYLSTKESSHE